MKKGLKLTLQITAILLVVAAIGAGIYWLVLHNNSGLEGGGRHGGGFEGMPKGNLPEYGMERHGGRDGINLTSGLWTAGRILLEIGVVTLGVLFIQWLIRKVRRPKAAAAVAALASSETPASQPEPVVEPAAAASEPAAEEPEDLFLPDNPEAK